MTIFADFEAIPGLQVFRFVGGFDADTGEPITTNPLGAGIPYTGREVAAWLADATDETNPIREVEGANPLTNSSFELFWFTDPDTMKAIYGASFSSSGWTFNAPNQNGITMLRWTVGSTDAPLAGAGDRGVQLTQATSGATGDILYADTTRRVAWVRNTNGTQFDGTNNITGTGVDFDPEAGNGNVASGEDNYLNLFTSGVIQFLTEIRIGQYDDRMGGAGTLTRLVPWWTARSSFPFVAVNPSGVKNVGQIDILLQTQEAGRIIDNRDVYGYAKQWGNTFAFGVGRGLIGRDQIVLETSNDPSVDNGYANAVWSGGVGTAEVGDIVRIQGVAVDRAVVTAVPDESGATGNFDYHLIGPGDDFVNTDLIEFFDADLVSQKTATVNGAPTGINAALSTGVTHDFGYVEIDIDNGAGLRPYAVNLNPNSQVFQEVHERDQYQVRDLSSVDLDANVDQLVEGQWYRGVGDALVLFDTQSGIFTEGERVFYDVIGASGTADTVDATGETLEDTTATFIANGVKAGDFVVNVTDNSWGVVLSITSETILEHTTLVEGIGNDWAAADVYNITRGSARLTAFDDTNDRLVLRDQRGPSTPADNDLINGLDSGASCAVLGTPSGIAELRSSPFGALAGSLFLGAQGVGILPANIHANDSTNYQLLDLLNATQKPPQAVSVSGNALAAGDRPFCSEVAVAGEPTLVKNQYSVNGPLTAYDTALDTDTAVGNNRSAAGDVVVVDVSAPLTDNNREIRYRYSARGASGFTLINGGAGTATSISADGTQLIDTAADFGGADDVEVGDVVNNETDGSLGFVAEIISTTELRLESIGRLSIGLTDGTGDDWGIGDVYSINTLARAYATTDEAFAPYFNSVATGVQKSVTVVHTVDIPVIFRNRFASGSNPSLKIKDDVQYGTITPTGVSFTARREPNPQAA